MKCWNLLKPFALSKVFTVYFQDVAERLLINFYTCFCLLVTIVPLLQASEETQHLPYPGGKNYAATLLTYKSDSSKVHALVATPLVHRAHQYPIVVANHGFHPDPPNYGVSADGSDWRPGDYYRSIPSAFAEHGFIVVMPDYRGHNKSEGSDVVNLALATTKYSEDVVSLLPHLADIPHADPSRIYMWGHSMGGDVTLRALQQTDQIKAASIWSTVGGEQWEQMYYYSRKPLTLDTHLPVDGEQMAQLRTELSTSPWRSLEPILNIEKISTPLNLHHALGDTGALYAWSRRIASRLAYLDKPHTFYTYAGSDHLFRGDQFRLAIERDVALFNQLVSSFDDAVSAETDPK